MSAELWESFGPARTVPHYRVELASWYPELAERIGSQGLARPPHEPDDYLRVYATREPIGDWGRAIVERAGHPGACLYRGRIFRHWRWGYLAALGLIGTTSGVLYWRFRRAGWL